MKLLPRTHAENEPSEGRVLAGEEKGEWRKVMKKEMQTLKQKKYWKIAKRLAGERVMSVKFDLKPIRNDIGRGTNKRPD